MFAPVVRLVVLALALALCGCVTVRAHERERLASRAMVLPFDDGRAAGEHIDKVVQSKTAAGLPGGAPGGGCGCTQ
jgi:hypothetical protein